ncbi:MAG: tRNA pseudouridine(13) synthase TruD [Halorhodospira sp.]
MIPAAVPAYAAPVGSARLRSTPEAFQVEELLAFRPSAMGEHCLVRVRKRGWTTEAVARLLAERTGVGRGGVSFAGLKDRHAVTTQWFSVHSPQPLPALVPGELEAGVRVLETVRNTRKLRRGALAGNRFTLRLDAVDAPPRAVGRRLQAVAIRGVPNYFGPQRFGREGRNLEQARRWLLQGEPVRGCTVRGLLLSAVRSECFNRLLARRVAAGTWDRLQVGDRAKLDGSGSHFAVECVDAGLLRRTVRGELHPTGPLPGVGGDGPAGAVASLEAEVLAEAPALLAALEARGVRADRRSLRLMPRRLAWRWPDAQTLELSFTLTSGGYATAVIAEVLATRQDDGFELDGDGR